MDTMVRCYINKTTDTESSDTDGENKDRRSWAEIAKK